MTVWDELLPMTKELGGLVLNAGCGNGIYSKRLKEEVPNVGDVVSLDILPKNTPHHGNVFTDFCSGYDWVQGDVQHLPFDCMSFDCVFCWDMLQNVPDARKALKEMARVTVAGGLIMIRACLSGGAFKVGDKETGSSGHAFTMYNLWTPDEFVEQVIRAGLGVLYGHFGIVEGPFLDSARGQSCLLMKNRR